MMTRRAESSVLFVASIAALALAGQAPLAHAADPERIVVTNARLVGRDAAAQDVAINILIVDGELVVVTKDELVIEPDDTAVDSNGGFLFGRLVVGARPSFVVLDQDPRENVDALLDTKTHARFAIREGVIVKNELQAIPAASAEDALKPRFWKAYGRVYAALLGHAFAIDPTPVLGDHKPLELFV